MQTATGAEAGTSIRPRQQRVWRGKRAWRVAVAATAAGGAGDGGRSGSFDDFDLVSASDMSHHCRRRRHPLQESLRGGGGGSRMPPPILYEVRIMRYAGKKTFEWGRGCLMEGLWGRRDWIFLLIF